MRLPSPLAILVTGLAGATAADAGRTLYQWATGFPPVNWSVTGRWFLMVLQGQPYVPGIGTAPSLPHELIAGHAAYYTISVVFAGRVSKVALPTMTSRPGSSRRCRLVLQRPHRRYRKYPSSITPRSDRSTPNRSAVFVVSRGLASTPRGSTSRT